MLRIENTTNLYGVSVSGDFLDLKNLYDATLRYLDFYYDTHTDRLDYFEYEYLLSLNYDIRHAFMGNRQFDVVDNGMDHVAGRLSSYFKDDDYEDDYDEEYDEEYDEDEYSDSAEHEQIESETLSQKQGRFQRTLQKTYSIEEADLRREEQFSALAENIDALTYGNMYFKVEFLYPIFMHYLVAYQIVLEEEPNENWLLRWKKKMEESQRNIDRYSLLQAQSDRNYLQAFFSLGWLAMRENFGKEIVDTWDKLLVNKFPMSHSSSTYTDALLHIEIAAFPELSAEDKKDFLICSFVEISEVLEGSRAKKPVSDLSGVKQAHALRVRELNNRLGKTVFPTQSELNRMLLKEFSGSTDIYEDEFDKFMKNNFGACLINDPVM